MIESMAPQTRAAFSATVSMTGWSSVGGAGDDPKDLRGGRLLLERLGQLAVSGLELRKQAHVLDRNHRLRGEGPRQLDLLVREGLHLTPSHDNDPNGYVFAEERRGQHRPGGHMKAPQAFLRLGECGLGRPQQVLDVDRLTVKHCASGHVSRAYCDGPADRG
jgi:hypothetical protein